MSPLFFSIKRYLYLFPFTLHIVYFFAVVNRICLFSAEAENHDKIQTCVIGY